MVNAEAELDLEGSIMPIHAESRRSNVHQFFTSTFEQWSTSYNSEYPFIPRISHRIILPVIEITSHKMTLPLLLITKLIRLILEGTTLIIHSIVQH